MSHSDLESMIDYEHYANSDDTNIYNLLNHPGFYRSPDQSYQDQQLHSEYIDQILGIDVDKIEGALNSEDYNDCEAWIGLAPRQLQTPYDELLMITQLLQLRENEHVLDLGAGYGRLGFVMEQQAPEAIFSGIELVSERVNAANELFSKHELKNANMLEGNLLAQEFDVASHPADVYFLYDFGQKEHLKHTLDQLLGHSTKNPFRIVARGSGVRSLIQNQYPRFFRVNDPLHFETFSLYSTP